MGLRPPIVRARAAANVVAPTSEPPTPVRSPQPMPVREPEPAPAPRITRPIPERLGPDRSAGMLRTEDAPRRHEPAQPVVASPHAPSTPIAHAVSTAYRVFDDYLEEGRQFAAGEIAWFDRARSTPDASRAGAWGPSFGDAVRGISWLVDQWARLAGAWSSMRPRPALPPAPPFHPQMSPDYRVDPRLASPHTGATFEPRWKPFFDEPGAPEGERRP